MKYRYYLFVLLLSCSLYAQAQETIFDGETVAFSSEQSGGIGMHTNGFHGFYRFGNYLTGFSKRVFEIEVANIRHPQEIKSVNPLEDDIKGYIYGKKNSFFTIRPSIGYHKVFIPKQSLKGVSVTYITQLGASLGLAKPVYLNIEKIDSQGNIVIVNERYDPKKHDQGAIYGRASLLNGLNKMKLHPGVFLKTGLQFEYGGSQEDIRAIEVGIMLDAFVKEIPIMAYAKNRQLYANFYIAFSIGNRKLK